ncbi:MAG: 4-hydroxy-tetrahydrodipicolinate synthase [Spirochaetes bacterium]|uniref:4-hydroxy-tetrahydrodipicolinate synthase n=1 Tax=Candidatus Ornithospirochaeta stercoripullorum TaxID=2840899 RepID=A0A9D9H5A2_9SPIO|nr:4-hydroxy-tetrahydrodipicolinate synthase [Candidatus Ornithospirochaeta stercoripullorum]
MTDFKGVYTALITPFTDLGTVDYKSLENIVNHQIEEGIDGLVPCGTTGESPTLSHEEHDRVIAQTVKYAAGRVPVIAGTGSNSTTEAIRLSQHAEDSGVDAVLLVNPYYNKPTQKGLFLHFKAIANSVKIPCILYNIKGRTGVNLETETLVRLTEECQNIVAVKEASGSLEQMKAVIEATNENFRVLSGDDNLALELIKLGGDGVISVASNLFPQKMATMVHAALEHREEEAERLASWFAPFFKACFLETNPIPIKTAMARYGWCRESFRLPMCALESSRHREELFAITDRMMEETAGGNN